MKILRLFLLLSIFIFGLINYTFAAINFTVSPIKYELEVNPGGNIIKTATLTNNGDTPVTIYTGKSDFESNGTGGTPSFVRYSELVHPDQQISSWITIDTPEFIIVPGQKRTVNFIINVPESATPGGHYGAVFFKNPNSEESGGSGNIGINVDYGVLILLNVSGEIVTDIDIDDPIINNGGGGTGHKQKKDGIEVGLIDDGSDDCVIDFTNSNFDGKCFDNPLELFNDFIDGSSELTDGSAKNPDNPSEDTGDTNTDVTTDLGDDDEFEVSFTFPIKNNGNIHIKPSGEIKLIDENGDQIKGVGKKNKVNEDGAIIGVEVVDYIPINDNGGNVLPNSQRKFEEEWKGFPYQTLDDEGNIVMKDMSPEDYYTKKNLGDNVVIMPWQRVCYRRNNKKIKALIDLVYTDHNGEEFEYSSAREFPVTYTEKYIGINLYVVIPFLLIVVILLLLWLVAITKKRRCINDDCRKKLKKKMVVCPYCGTKQPNYKEEDVIMKVKKRSSKKKSSKEKIVKKVKKK